MNLRLEARGLEARNTRLESSRLEGSKARGSRARGSKARGLGDWKHSVPKQLSCEVNLHISVKDW